MTITPEDITAAATRIAPHVRQTPLWRLPSSALGMFNRLLSHPIPAAGVIAASGGNAGIATAVAAQALGAQVVIAGAGTLAREIEAQHGTPDTVLMSVGSGGLIVCGANPDLARLN